MRPSSAYRALCALLLLAPACITLEDIPLPKDAGETSVANEDADTWSELDAEVDSGSSEVDSGTVWRPDEWDAEVDSGSVPQDSGTVLRACSGSQDCELDEYCSPVEPSIDRAPRSVCRPKCADGTCATIFTERNVSVLWADSDALYWATYPSTDPLGNPRRDGELWRMQSGQTPKRLADQLSEESQFVIHRGHAYYRSRQQLFRVPVDLSGAAQPLYELPAGESSRWNVGGSAIVIGTSMGLATGSPDGSTPLKTVYSGGIDRGPPAWVAEDSLYFVPITDGAWSFKSMRLVEPYAVEDTVFPSVLAAMIWDVRAPYVYTHGGRVDLRDGRIETVVGSATLSDDRSAQHREFIYGDWIYLYVHNGERDQLARWSLISLGVGQELIPEGVHAWYGENGLAEGFSGALFAPYGNSLYIVSPRGRIIHERPLPLDPCETNLPCPNGKSCGSDKLCH
jgi:hypothetical protein